MNDEFLHRIRKTPPPEFLAGLKARLDRQLLAAPVPAIRARRQRWSFTRGLITGLLLGGAAFALTAVSLDRGPQSLRSFVRAPVEWLARLMPRGSQQGTEQHWEQQPRIVPLGPVWLPEHPGAAPPAVATQSASLTPKGANNPGANATSAAPRPSSTVVSGVASPAAEFSTLLASSTTYELATNAARRIKVGGYRVQVELERESPFGRLCTPDSPDGADMAELSRRITQDEFRRCTRNFVRIVEVKFGYQALALARARLYGPLKLTARDLFLALAQHVPDPNLKHPESWIDNPYTTWNQVDAALPYDRIQVIGPSADSRPGALAADLLLQAGCNTYPWIAAKRDSDPHLYQEMCGTLREDGAYRVAVPSDWATDLLATNPTAIGVFSLAELRNVPATLVFNPIDGVEPLAANIASGTYPAARTLYLYANKSRVLLSQIFPWVVRTSMAQQEFYFIGPSSWGFLPLDGNESATTRANAQTLKELQF